MSQQLTPVCFVVTVPFAGRDMAVGPFAQREDAQAFADAFLARVEVEAGELTLGPMYADEDVLGILEQE